MTNETSAASPAPFPLRQWARLPLTIRAIASGLFVFAVLQFGWNAFVMLNMRIWPAIPWNVPLGLFYLWLLFQLFNGRWGPRSTREARKQCMRARRMTREEWGSAFVASLAVAVFVISFLSWMQRLVPIQGSGINLPTLPWWSEYSILVMISIVAGVSEEAGFRGYIQGPLERRYGAVVAIGMTATVFWLAHLNHSSGFALLPSLIVAGSTFGALAYSAQSILPVIVVHAAVDIIQLVGSTAEIGPHSFWEPPLLGVSGADPGFLATLAIAVLSGVAAAFAMRRLAVRIRNFEEAIDVVGMISPDDRNRSA
jgi:membrane protease YdiL (CAAX protease family)